MILRALGQYRLTSGKPDWRQSVCIREEEITQDAFWGQREACVYNEREDDDSPGLTYR